MSGMHLIHYYPNGIDRLDYNGFCDDKHADLKAKYENIRGFLWNNSISKFVTVGKKAKYRDIRGYIVPIQGTDFYAAFEVDHNGITVEFGLTLNACRDRLSFLVEVK